MSISNRRALRPARPVASPVLATMVALAVAMSSAHAQPHNAAALPAMLATQTARLDAAREEYEVGHFAAAFASFAQLADEGHCGAARVARQMARYGRPLYAIDFEVTPERLERWQRLPACPVAVAGGNAKRRVP